MRPQRPRPGARRRGAVRALAAAAVAVAFGPATAGAAEPYSETARFGGFDAAYFNGGGYDGGAGPAPGRFLNPTSFAVDPADPDAPGQTAVYVLDRTSRRPAELGSARSQWRLQKLSETGEVLGVATFSLPGDVVETGIPPIGGIAVESGSAGSPGRVHLVLSANDTFAAVEVVAFSTEVSGGRLASPAGLPADAVTQPTGGSNPAGVLSRTSQLDAGESVVFPSGLAVAGTGADRTLAVLGYSGDFSTAQVTRIALADGGGRSVGDKLGSWTNAGLAGLPNATSSIGTYQPDYGGIARREDGSLIVSLSAFVDGSAPPPGAPANVAVVELSATLAQPRLLVTSRNSPGAVDNPSLGQAYTRWAPVATPGAGEVKPSAHVVPLAGDRYASAFVAPGDDVPWMWSTLTAPANGQHANLGLRLLAPVAAPGEPWDGTLANPGAPSRSIVNTLGSTTGAGACAIALEAESVGRTNVGLAAGREGSVWILTGGSDAQDATSAGRALDGHEVIELSPGRAGQPCAQPQGTYELRAGARALDAAQTVTVPVATALDFDAAPLGGGGWISKVEWDLDGDAGNGYEVATGWDPLVVDPPVTTARRQYTRAGTYELRLRIHGDFGVVERATRLVVEPAARPVAAFAPSATSVLVGQPVSFDASASRPSPDTTIANYRWDFGDGVVEDTQTPQVDHVFGAAGTYPVKLTVRGSDNQVSAAETVTITVTAPVIPPPIERRPIETPPDRRPIDTPPPADTTAPAVTVKAAGAREAVALTISCPAGETSCAGTAKLTVKVRVAGRARRGRRARARTRTVTVGLASFSVAGGASTRVTVKLNGSGKALLRRSRSLKVTVSVAARDAAGNATTRSASATVKRAASRAGRRRGRR